MPGGWNGRGLDVAGALVIELPSTNRLVSSGMLKNVLFRRLLKKVQMQGGARGEARGVRGRYVAAPRERANAAGGPFSAAC